MVNQWNQMEVLFHKKEEPIPIPTPTNKWHKHATT